MATIVAAAGGGNWNATTTWTGGVVPTAADDVQLAATSGNVTLTAVANCRSLDCTGYTGTLALGVNSFNIGDATAGLSNIALKLVSTMTYTGGGQVSFLSTSATQQTIATGGKTIGGGLVFNGVGGSWKLLDAVTNGGNWNINAGSLDTNGQTISTSTFQSATTSTKSLTLGTSSITCTGWNFATTTGLTLSAASSTITDSATTFSGGGFTYGTVVLTQGANVTISGANTFGALTRSGTAVKTGQLTLAADQVVTGTFTVNGNSAINRVLVMSDTLGTARTITAGTVSASNVDFQDVTGAGAGNWNLASITGNSGDCGGNSGITFTTSATQTATGTASFTWSTHGWTTRVPLPQDDVVINNAFAATRTITSDMPRLGRSIDFTGTTGNPTFTISAAGTMYGSLTMASGITYGGSQGITLAGRGSYTITGNGVTFNQLTFAAFGGTYTFGSDISTGTGNAIVLNNGSLVTNNYNVTSTVFQSNSGATRSLTLGTSTWTLTTNLGITAWNVTAAGLTFSGASSTIVIGTTLTSTRTFAGAGFTYGTLTYTLAGSTGGLTITGNNTFDTLNFSDASNGRTLTITSGSTQTITNWNVNGQNALGMTIAPSSTTNYTLKGNAKNWRSTYITISRCTFTATAGELFFAGGATSVDGGNNTGVRFDTPSDLTTTQPGVARVAENLTKTQSATAKITTSGFNKTQTATARIAVTGTTTQLAIARVAVTVTKTQAVIGRVAQNLTKPQPATARVAQNLVKTEPAIARIAVSSTKTQSAAARVAVTVTRTQSVVARVAVGRTQTQSATAHIASTATGTKTQTATARITLNRSASQPAVTRIAVTPTTTQPARARVAVARTTAQSATAHVVVSISRTATQAAISRVAVSRTLTQTATARAAINRASTQTGLAAIAATRTATQSSGARLARTVTRTQSATATISFVPPGTGAGAVATMRRMADLASSVAPASVLTVGVTTP